VDNPKATFAYPNGHSLEVKAPSVPILTSGQSSYPLNRPIISHATIGDRGGSLTVIGSAHIFCDEWIKAESNAKLLGFLVDLAITGRAELNQIEAEHPEVTERFYTPDIASMSERLRSCIQESEKMRSNFDENFDRGLFKMDLGYLSETQKLAQTLGLKNEPIETVAPQFDTALPPLTPAVFPPQMRDAPGPVLELFDLDDAFSSSKTRLAQLAQRPIPRTPSSSPYRRQRSSEFCRSSLRKSRRAGASWNSCLHRSSAGSDSHRIELNKLFRLHLTPIHNETWKAI
jgi:intraflagellar transport protein 52